MLFCASLLDICLFLFWLRLWHGDDCCTPILPVMFTHGCQYNGIWCDCPTSERFSAIKSGSIHNFLHLKMRISSQEYDSCFQFVWCVLSFDFAIKLGTFRFEFFSEFSSFVILLFFVHLRLLFSRHRWVFCRRNVCLRKYKISILVIRMSLWIIFVQCSFKNVINLLNLIITCFCLLDRQDKGNNAIHDLFKNFFFHRIMWI